MSQVKYPIHICPKCGSDQYVLNEKRTMFHCIVCDKYFKRPKKDVAAELWQKIRILSSELATERAARLANHIDAENEVERLRRMIWELRKRVEFEKISFDDSTSSSSIIDWCNIALQHNPQEGGEQQ